MKRTDFDYDLPPELIADRPVAERDGSRLLTLDRGTGRRSHHHFRQLLDLLEPEDVLVFNDSRVIPARLWARKRDSGGRVELLLVEAETPGTPSRWWALARASKGLRPGQRLDLEKGDGISVEVTRVEGRQVLVACPHDLLQVALQLGELPLPPYMNRSAEAADTERYQTVYAQELGSVAAPTAGLHFTPQLLRALEQKGIQQAFLTLHVGPGTFLPVHADDVADHRMHAERFVLPASVVDAVHETRKRGGRVVAVGTTVTRVLESFADGLHPGPGATELFILPGHRFQWVDGLITNFHLPQSTLIMLVAAFAGRDLVLDSYREAVEKRYRFYSYGDAMFIR